MNRRRYAEGTSVPVERSRAEVERLLRKAGATGLISAWDDEDKVDRLVFRIDGRMVRLEVNRPTASDFAKTTTGRRRKRDASGDAAEREYQRRWRALVLLVKAKLEVIADGLSTIEREFLADMLLPNGSTLGEEMAPRLAQAYQTGAMDTRLPLLGPGGGA